MTRTKLSLALAAAVGVVVGACSYGLDEYELVDGRDGSGGRGQGGEAGGNPVGSGGESDSGGSGGSASGGTASGGAASGGTASGGTGGIAAFDWQFKNGLEAWQSMGGSALYWDEEWDSLMFGLSNYRHGACVQLEAPTKVTTAEASFMWNSTLGDNNDIGVQIGLRSATGDAWSQELVVHERVVEMIPVTPQAWEVDAGFDGDQVESVCFRVSSILLAPEEMSGTFLDVYLDYLTVW